MFPGFNSEIVSDNLRYHVQTEVLGARDPAILTLVYRAGAIVNRVKRNYLEILGEDPSDEEVRFLAERQHRRVIDEIQGGSGSGDARGAPPPPPGVGPGAEAAEEKSLEQIILDYLNAKSASEPDQTTPPPVR